MRKNSPTIRGRAKILSLLRRQDATVAEVLKLFPGLSHNGVWRRLKAMEAEGLIHVVGHQLVGSARAAIYGLTPQDADAPRIYKGVRRTPRSEFGPRRDPLTAALFGSYNT